MSIPTKRENPKGLHQRYVIKKVVGEEVYVERRWINVDRFNGDFRTLSEDCPTRLLTKEIDEGAEYFIMRLDLGGSDIKHIKACRIGIHAYADAIEDHLPELAMDLRERYPQF